MPEIKLKPCPFCGGEAEYVRMSSGFQKIRCKKCYAQIEEQSTKWDAAVEWNSRFTEKEMPPSANE
ncbi:MAG: Lar family restriction alleviation protein [Oscillospiraceae bacterium]|nr:Lar family restriction alleviation protein [Oscillospiraceae bacterium]